VQLCAAGTCHAVACFHHCCTCVQPPMQVVQITAAYATFWMLHDDANGMQAQASETQPCTSIPRAGCLCLATAQAAVQLRAHQMQLQRLRGHACASPSVTREVQGPGKSLNSFTWHSGVGGGRREFEPGQEQGIDGAEGCRAVAKWRRAAACVVRIRGWLP
jgi:hypothetical protein